MHLNIFCRDIITLTKYLKIFKKNNLSKSVVISNVQLEIIKKYLIGKMFEKEYDDYLNEIRKIVNDKKNEIDLEQIIVKTNKKNVEIINSIDNQISLYLTKVIHLKK